MPPKARTSRAAAPDAKGTPAKRGRPPATVKVVENEAETELTRKRGRPAGNTTATGNEAEQPKKRGRPAKLVEEAAAAPVTDSPKRGRPAKQKSDKLEELAKNLPKRGRPAKGTSLNLNRVAGSSRVAKSTSSSTKTTRPPSSRVAPIMRSRLRTRVPVMPKAEVVVVKKPAAKRGRPKLQTKAGPSKKSTVREMIQVKPKKERKRRGFTMLEIPDKFVKEMKKSLQELMTADAAKTVETVETVETEETDQSEQEKGDQQDQLPSEQPAKDTATQEQESQKEQEQEQLSDDSQEKVRDDVAEPEESSEAVLDIDLEFQKQQMQQINQEVQKGENAAIIAAS